jgi:hypothetical protein
MNAEERQANSDEGRPTDKLTAVAVGSQKIVCEKWLKLVLSTDPVELCRAQTAITRLFLAGAQVEGRSLQSCRPPRTTLLCESPVSAALTMLILRMPPIVRWRGNYFDEDFQYRHTASIPDAEPVDRWRGRFPDEVWSSAQRNANIVTDPQLVGQQVSEDQSVTTAHMRLRLYQSQGGLRENERNRDLRNRLLEICWQGLPEVQRAHDALWGAISAAIPNELLEYVESLRSYVIFDLDHYDLFSCLLEYDYLQHVCGRYYADHGAGMERVDAFCRIYRPKLAALVELAESCPGWILYEDLAILLDRPCEIHFDTHQQPHNPNGMAVKYRDGWGVYCWRGIPVPREVVEHPERITVEEIEQERNADIRRVKIQRYGFDRYVRDARVREVQCDEFGILYRRDLASGEPALAFVKVIKASPEPDGRREEYVLPVSPNVQTAHDAVASTSGLRVEDYWPIADS